MERVSRFLQKYEKWIPVLLVLVFFAVTAPGTDWGLPKRLHPHEVVKYVFLQLNQGYLFDTEQFLYPSLPKYVLLGIAKVILWFGGAQPDIYLAARLTSVVLGGSMVAFTYHLTRRAGGGVFTALFAAMLLITNSQMAMDARFAHNDIYLAFFTTLVVVFLVRYVHTARRGWLYLAFLSVGMGISSKYNGIPLVAAPLAVFLYIQWEHLRKDSLRALETIFIGIALTGLGYGLGTPRAVLAASWYFRRMIPAFLNSNTYELAPDAVIGLFGQWGTLIEVLGWPVFILSIAAVVLALVRLVRYYRGKTEDTHGSMQAILVMLVVILIVDLPLLVSFLRRPRYTLPMVPLVMVLVALFVQWVISRLNARQVSRALQTGVVVVSLLVLGYSALRVVSIDLLFFNDARMPAAEYVAALPQDASIEYTLYPPPIDRQYFTNETPYPIHFYKWDEEREVLAEQGIFYNFGEEGIEKRKPEFFIIDSFTYARLDRDFICQDHLNECEFFNRLLAGETNYELVESFTFDLPGYLPQLEPLFLNPDIHIYQRIPGR
jgi:hypothetical protein